MYYKCTESWFMKSYNLKFMPIEKWWGETCFPNNWSLRAIQRKTKQQTFESISSIELKIYNNDADETLGWFENFCFKIQKKILAKYSNGLQTSQDWIFL